MSASPRPAAPQPPYGAATAPPRTRGVPILAAALLATVLLPCLAAPPTAAAPAAAASTGPAAAAPAAAASTAPAAPPAPAPPEAGPARPTPAGAPAAPSQPAGTPAAGAGGLEAEVARLTAIGGCWSPSFSPDGLRLAFVSNQSGVPQVWMVATDGVRPQQVSRLDDQVSEVEWSPDGRWLAFTLAPGGGMNSQVYMVRPDGQQLSRVSEGGRINNRLTGFSHDGRLMLLSSNRADPASLDPFTYEVATGLWRRAAGGGGDGELSDVSRDGRYGLVERVRQRGDQEVSLVDLRSGRETPLTPHQAPAEYGAARFAPDGMMVYLASNQGRDRVAFARLRLGRGAGGELGPAAGGALEVLASRDDAELDDFRITEDGHVAALSWNAAGRSQLTFLDLDTLARQPVPALPGEIVSDMAFSRNGRLLAVTLSGSRLPRDVWVVDRASGRLRQVTRAAHAGVELAELTAPELVHFPALDGLELSGWLYRPLGHAAPAASVAPGLASASPTRPTPSLSPPPVPTAPVPSPPSAPGAAGSSPSPPAGAGPVVLSFHGGPEAEERPGFSPLYQALLARGIAVLAPNVRGSAGFGRRFVDLDNGALRAGAVRDIRAAAEYLVREGIADPRRIGIMGGSYGGYMTMAGLTEFPELFAAGSDLYGIVNFETFFEHTEPWMAAISKVEYGDPATQREMLRALSPIHKLDRVRAPTLVLHGANDTNVPVVEAEQVVDSLKRRGVPVEYVLFPDEGHGFRKTPNRIRSTVAIVHWFEQYLK